MVRSHALRLSAVLVLSVFLNIWNNTFPLGYHVDEPVKVGFIKSGTQDYHHPLLILQMVRIANTAAGFDNDQQVVMLGRSIMALCGTATVLVSYWLARRVMAPGTALLAAAGVAAAPTLGIHAHYLKEDTVLTLWLLASLLAFVRFVERVNLRSAAALGVSVGLACSSHYKGLLLLPFFLAAPFLNPGRPGANRRQYLLLAAAALVAALVFLAVNWPLVLDVRAFLAGAGFEMQHAIEGEDARPGLTDFWLGFHLLYSLAPGMTWTALVAGLIGLTWTVARWRHVDVQDRLVAAYALLFYLVPEIAPLKPAPDFARYVIPVVPALVYLATRSADTLARGLPPAGRRALFSAASIALVVLPLYSTVRLIGPMNHDTRAQAGEWVQQHGGRSIVEQYAGLEPDIWTAANVNLDQARAGGVAWIVTSSFMYDRYFLGNRLRNQDANIYRFHDQYTELFSRPYVEIAPPYRSFGFTNPVIRIVDIRSGG